MNKGTIDLKKLHEKFENMTPNEHDVLYEEIQKHLHQVELHGTLAVEEQLRKYKDWLELGRVFDSVDHLPPFRRIQLFGHI